MELNETKYDYILITSSNFPTGGAGASYLYLFCKGLKESHCNISVWLLKGFAFGTFKNNEHKKNITNEGIKYLYLSTNNRAIGIFLKIIQDLVAIFKLIIYTLKLAKKRKTTRILLYSNDLQFNLPLFILSRLLQLKIITFVPEFYDKSTFNGSLIHKLKWYTFLFNFNFLNILSDRLIVFSYYLKELYIKKGVKETKIIIQPNLTDFDFWQFDKMETEYELGYSGTPTLKDGLLDLLKSINILKNSNISIRLLVIGDSTFGPSLIPNLKNVCEKLEISELVTFTGLVDSENVRKNMAKCKILVLTRPNILQTRAGFPTKLGEYIASKKQVLTTNFGDITKYFSPMTEIVTSECGDINDISNKITWMLKHPEKSEEIREAGYFRAKQLLSYNSSVNRIIKLF